MRIELLKYIASMLIGERAKNMVDLLFGKKKVNEFLIAKKLNLTINQTRNLLYKLADEDFVNFVRKKDSKKGGWYVYYWTLNEDKSLFKFKDIIKREIENMKNQLNIKKTEKFYHCLNCGIELNEEHALIQEYTCLECGEIMQMKDNSKELISLEKEIMKNEKMLEDVEAELEIIRQKVEKDKIRKMKADEKRKAQEKAAKKRMRKREMKKAKNKERADKRTNKKARKVKKKKKMRKRKMKKAKNKKRKR
ncbi:MAG: hypothetical protein AABW65_01475 [Nanoarchaeota archaeon]